MDIQFSWLKSEMFSVMSCEAGLTGLPGTGKFFISSPTEYSDDHVLNAKRLEKVGLGLGGFHIWHLHTQKFPSGISWVRI